MVTLDDLLSPIRRETAVLPDSDYPLLGVRWYAKGLFRKETKSGADISASKLYRIEMDDFVYSRLFAWKGSFAVATADDDGCFVSNEFLSYRADPGRLLPEFLHMYFSQEHTWAEALGLSEGATPTSRNRLKEDRFLAMRIPLPPLPEQKRIVAKVQSLATKIDEARELRADINTDRIAALRSLFRRITDGAPRRPMSEVAPLERRPVHIKEDESYPELGIRSFGRGTFHKPTLQGSELTWQKLFRIYSGDIVLSNIKAWEGAIGVATEEDHNRVGSHRYLTCVVNPDAATANFVCFYLLTREGLEHVGHASPGSADRNRTLGMRALMDIPVPVPSLHIQHHFDRVHRQMTETTQAEVQSGKKLDALVPAVLDRAFKGEL